MVRSFRVSSAALMAHSIDLLWLLCHLNLNQSRLAVIPSRVEHSKLSHADYLAISHELKEQEQLLHYIEIVQQVRRSRDREAGQQRPSAGRPGKAWRCLRNVER